MGRHVLTGSLLVGVVLIFGCAKRPVTPIVSAPPPSGVAASSAMTAAPGGRSIAQAAMANPTGQGGTTSAGVGRPAPNEFVAVLGSAGYPLRVRQARHWPPGCPDPRWQCPLAEGQCQGMLLIEGHCDERGTEQYNLVLGDRRAKAAMDYLIAQGVAERRITVITFGKERPVCTEHDEACWAKNRRAHVLVKHG